MTDSVETTRCSNCKRDILKTNFVIHDLHCQRNIYLCPKCNEPVNHNQRAEHDEANHVLVFCSGCHTKVEKYKLNKHLKDDCSQRKIKCQICDIEIGACDIDEHENYCGARTEICSECGEFVMLKYKQLHIDSNHTFIKLSDEPGPSPSWQNGRRTLGNFLPDLQSGLYTTTPSHQKKRLGRSDHGRRRAKGSPEFVEKDDKTKELTSPNGKQKYSGYQRNFDGACTSHSRDCRRRVSGGGSDYTGGRSRMLRDSASDEVEKVSADGKEVNSTEGVNSDCNPGRSKGKERLRRLSGSSTKPKQVESLRETNHVKELARAGTNTDEDSSLALALQLSDELNGGFHLDNEELIAQAIDKNAAVLSEFSLFDSVDKNKATSDKNLYTGKKPNKTASKSRLEYQRDDSSDDEFFLYSKSPGKDLDDTSLPCQFCNSMYPSYALMSHQEECKSNGNFNLLGADKYQRKRSVKKDKEDLVPCRICYRLIPISLYESHQFVETVRNHHCQAFTEGVIPVFGAYLPDSVKLIFTEVFSTLV